MTNNYDDEELGYVSSSPLFGSQIQTKLQDEVDLPALKGVQASLEKSIYGYSQVTSLKLGDPTFTVEQQLAINQEVIAQLTSVKAIVDVTIEDIREKYSNAE